MWLELISCVKGDNTLFHWLVSHNHTSLSVDPPCPPIITNTVPVMCDAAWVYLLSGHWTDWLTGFLILLQFWEDKDIMDFRNRKTNTSRLIDYRIAGNFAGSKLWRMVLNLRFGEFNFDGLS